ncbi:MAG: chemotaxis protein CheD [Planctomycetota bacterium]|jgi:chemotaxis protein CheD|nr:chemotaxis protein CheD [Planctomycetota bacterium]
MRGTEYLPTQFFLKPGYVMANHEATIIRTVLGNCVAVTFFDIDQRFGGINQFAFPRAERPKDRTPQYGNIGIRALYKMLLGMGASREKIVAQIVGGSECQVVNDQDLGLKNVDLARHVLKKLQIPVISEDVGGGMGRKVLYHSGTNEMAVFKVDCLRKSDWFVPGMDLRYDNVGR